MHNGSKAEGAYQLQAKIHIDCLDGLRGLAALWVLVGHACILTGRPIPIIDEPDLGVDLFVILSGFLMAFHYQLRAAKEPWESPSTWTSFWQRRFFRIAPLYYVLLAVALVAGPMIYDARMVIDTALQHAPQESSRYEDRSLLNILAHATFVFGLIPDYAFRTALPDWSIGLEMQFYAAFPALMLLTRRLGWIVGAAIITAISVAIVIAVTRAGVAFPMPSFLPLKIPFFLVGMLCAAGIGQSRGKVAVYLAMAVLLAAIPMLGNEFGKLAVRLAIVVAFFALVHYRHLGAMTTTVAWSSRLLGARPFHWLGELSFGAYLWHLLIMQPVAAWTFQHLPDLGRSARFGLVCAVVIPITYGLAYATYRLIEQPGLKLGRRRPTEALAGA